MYIFCEDVNQTEVVQDSVHQKLWKSSVKKGEPFINVAMPVATICSCADICCIPASTAGTDAEGTAAEERSALGFVTQETVITGGEWQDTKSAGD